MNPEWWEIDIHGCYSLVKIAFAPFGTCKNNRRIWHHNASTPRSRDVTDQLWWRHNAKSERPSLRQLRNERPMIWFGGIVCSGQIASKKVPMIFSRDFVTREKSLANRLTRDPKIVVHGNLCIILYMCVCVCVLLMFGSKPRHNPMLPYRQLHH